VVVDRVTAYWGDIDANKDKEVRPVMNLLDSICEQTKITFLAVCHLNKRADADSMGKILGASSLPGAARALWGFYKDPDKEKKGEYFMSQIKVNSAKRSDGLKYCIAEEPIEIEGSVEFIPRTEWLGVSELTADDVADLAKAKAKETENGE
jgi:AAA domain